MPKLWKWFRNNAKPTTTLAMAITALATVAAFIFGFGFSAPWLRELFKTKKEDRQLVDEVIIESSNMIFYLTNQEPFESPLKDFVLSAEFNSVEAIHIATLRLSSQFLDELKQITISRPQSAFSFSAGSRTYQIDVLGFHPDKKLLEIAINQKY